MALGLVLACGVAGAAWARGGGGGGGGHGGGGHGGGRGYIVTYTSISGYAPKGAPVYIPLDATDAPVAAADGTMKRGDVIARHTLRAAEAVVLLAPAKGRWGEVPAGAVLTLVRLKSGGPSRVWCDIRPTHRLLFPLQHDCFEDAKGGGKFDWRWDGDAEANFLGWSASGAQAAVQLETPVAYRPARPEERPAFQLGYKFCDGDGVSGPPRFAIVMASADSANWPVTGICAFGVWPDGSDRSKVQVDALRLTVHSGPGGALAYRVENRIPPGRLSRLGPDQPIRVEPPALAVSSSAPPPLVVPAPPPLVLPVRRESLVQVGPVQVVAGPVGVGQTFLTVPVKHGLTGRLMNRIVLDSVFGRDAPLEVGQPVFGIPIGGAGDKTIWCAPRRRSAGPGYESACLVQTYGAYYDWQIKRTPAMMPSDIGRANGFSSGAASSAPSVEPGPIELPPMTLSMILKDIKPDPKGPPDAQIYDVDLALDWGEGAQVYAHRPFAITKRGGAARFMDVALIFMPGPGAQQITISQRGLQPPPPHAPPSPPVIQ